MKKIALLTLCSCIFTHAEQALELRWEELKHETLEYLQPQIIGWGSKEKGEIIMELIHETKPRLCLEIGTFAGATTLPMARALQYNGQGILYSVDAWDNYAAIENMDSTDPNLVWLGSFNMEALQNQCIGWVNQLGLNNICMLVKMRSSELESHVENNSVDLLYLDGNSSQEGSLLDAFLFFPKVKYGGYILIPEAHLPTKVQAVSFLMNNAVWYPEKSYKNQLLVFRKE